MIERPHYDGPQNLGQLRELSEDAQKIWEAYQELSDYVDKLPDPNTISDIGENEELLLDLVQEIWGLMSDTESKTAKELSTEIQSVIRRNEIWDVSWTERGQ